MMQQSAPMEVGLPVINLDGMVDFYTTVLGCSEVRRADIPAALSSAIQASADGYVNVWLQTPNKEVIKLMRPPRDPVMTAPAENYSERTGFAYLTFYCANLEAVLRKAEANGAVLRSDRSTLSGEIGVKIAFFADPEGNIIELVEPV